MSLPLRTRPCNGEPSAQRDLTSHLLQLPVELVVAIASQVPRHSQILASQSCRALRNVLCDSLLPGDDRLPENLPRREQVEFLLHLSRGSPGEWVCEECMELHQAFMHDTPAKPMSEAYLPCFFPGFFGQGQDLNIHDIYGFKMNHRHVQLALKHARLAATESLDTTYLQRLLQPHHKRIRSRYTRKHLVDAKYSAFLKVVDGRFVVKTTFDFREGYDKVHRKYLGTVALCGHQIAQACDAQVAPGPSSSGSSDDSHPLWALKTAVSAAYQSPGEEVSGRCEFCGTDFAVKASPERVTMTAWKDFGPEGTSYDPYWRSHASRVFSTRTACRMAGSIRELYGEGTA
ncbi:hypothetical protein BBK36DRAFT_1127074 [Trichoderma citrinoviride]|uniref:F-box domain-containing protein n=1 Tax=Trichoderma citrinoviride TaxID=58853 RepID=A0A2T4B1E8_9HYPO|nr:hypothetical protein BBK36DRAFT_1127074 [Trichoderma citrinoviride]PTB63041.1 hypothetical protein BBK36DRAFT_1127074 [Trichoderma citrinoviride]